MGHYMLVPAPYRTEDSMWPQGDAAATFAGEILPIITVFLPIACLLVLPFCLSSAAEQQLDGVGKIKQGSHAVNCHAYVQTRGNCAKGRRVNFIQEIASVLRLDWRFGLSDTLQLVL